MRVARLSIQNFRGIETGAVNFDGDALLVGANSIGKSTICEALDLALGLDRLYRRPVVDEFDFFRARYQEPEDGGTSPEIRIEVLLTDLSPDAERYFRPHLCPWSTTTRQILEEEVEGSEFSWCLPILFLGRFNRDDDDFEGDTFFSRPAVFPSAIDDLDNTLGSGLMQFRRADKRLCGFLYLRANRTGRRALSFQHGSLLDTIAELESDESAQFWGSTLREVSDVAVASADSGFESLVVEVQARVGRFLALSGTDHSVDIRVSELTREHLREVVRLFVATQPGEFSVPFNRLSTGSLNLMVFALLTYIAELKGSDSVIFAMEEPEIALPPHSQRLLIRFITENMGQAIVTSHSPYIIEHFEPESIVVLGRTPAGELQSNPVTLPASYKLRRYRRERRQFAEAVLARGVLVVEGETEVDVVLATADALNNDPQVAYTHPDLCGLSVFDAHNDVSVPVFAPIFKSMDKLAFGMHDTPTAPLTPDQTAMTASFDRYEVLPYSGLEELLTTEMPVDVQRTFLADVVARLDYPAHCGRPGPSASDAEVAALTLAVLKERKGSSWHYAAMLIATCSSTSELPATLVSFLLAIDSDLAAASAGTSSSAPDGD